MSKKIFIIIISLALTLLLVGLVTYYFVIQGQNGSSTTPSGFRGFLPFGGNGAENGTTTVTNTPTPENPPANFTQKLRELSIEPVSGAGTSDVKIGTTTKSTQTGTVVRYIEKATGHIFEVELFSPKQDRISNTTIPLVYDAIWGNKNGSLVARYLKDDNQTVDTYSLNLKSTATTSENTITGIAFPPKITDLSVFDGNIFYLLQNGSGSQGFVSGFDGKGRKQIWNSVIREWNSQYVNTRTVALTTKPTSNMPGFLYFVDTSTGQVKKVLSSILGLSSLTNPLATSVLYLEQTGGVRMFISDLKNKSTNALTPSTFPEKCVWSIKDKNIIYCAVPRENLDGNSLTNWYKGLISTSDDVWKYDIKNSIATIVGNLSDNPQSESIDVMKPILSENEQYLVFINKTNNSLWSLDLTK